MGITRFSTHAHVLLTQSAPFVLSNTNNTTMGLGAIITALFEPCRSAPKSPPCPSPDKQTDADRRATANASERTIVEVLPCGDVTNITPCGDASSPTKPVSHAEGFSVSQIRKPEESVKAAQDKLEEERDERQKLILAAFGFEVQRMLNSKAWDDRAQALAMAREKCAQGDIGDEAAFCDACCKLALVSLQDKVMPIYFDGLELCKFLFGELFDRLAPSKEIIRANIEELLPVIIAKTADRNARSNEGTRSMLCFLARCPSIGCSPVMAHIFSPIGNSKEISAIRGRLELIDHVIDQFGFGKSTTITMQLVMGFVRPHLDATDEKVRRAAIEVTVNCFKYKGERTLKYITNVKPALLKLLQQRFAEINKPGKTSRKNAKSALPEVRGKPRKHLAPKRDCLSQPVGSGGEGFFQKDNTEVGSVLNDCPGLFGMGNNTQCLELSPTSSQSREICRDMGDMGENQDPNFIMSPVMPGSVPNETFRMGAEVDGLTADLDGDLMDEIEAI